MEGFPQVEDVAFSLDNRYLFAAYRNGQVCVWQLLTDTNSLRISSTPHAKMVCHGDLVSALLVTSDGKSSHHFIDRRFETSSLGLASRTKGRRIRNRLAGNYRHEVCRRPRSHSHRGYERSDHVVATSE